MKNPQTRKTTAERDKPVSGWAGRWMTWGGVNIFSDLAFSMYDKAYPKKVFASYQTLDDATKDILLWMQNTKFKMGIKTLEDFVYEMAKESYFTGETANEYLAKVKAFQKVKYKP